MQSLARDSEKYKHLQKESKLLENSMRVLSRMLKILRRSELHVRTVVNEKNLVWCISFLGTDATA